MGAAIDGRLLAVGPVVHDLEGLQAILVRFAADWRRGKPSPSYATGLSLLRLVPDLHERSGLLEGAFNCAAEREDDREVVHAKVATRTGVGMRMTQQSLDHEAVSLLASTIGSVLPKVTFPRERVRKLIEELSATFEAAGYPASTTANGLSVRLDRSTPTADSVWLVVASYLEEEEKLALEVQTIDDTFVQHIALREFHVDPPTGVLLAGKITAVRYVVIELGRLLHDEVMVLDSKGAAEDLERGCSIPNFAARPQTSGSKAPVIVARIPKGVAFQDLPESLRQPYYQGYRLKLDWV